MGPGLGPSWRWVGVGARATGAALLSCWAMCSSGRSEARAQEVRGSWRVGHPGRAAALHPGKAGMRGGRGRAGEGALARGEGRGRVRVGADFEAECTFKPPKTSDPDLDEKGQASVPLVRAGNWELPGETDLVIQLPAALRHDPPALAPARVQPI